MENTQEIRRLSRVNNTIRILNGWNRAEYNAPPDDRVDPLSIGAYFTETPNPVDLDDYNNGYLRDSKVVKKQPLWKMSGVRVYENGFEIRSPQKVGFSPNGGGKRGTIKEFSGSARLRCMRFLHSILMSDLGTPNFLTLTYHNEWENRDWKRDLDVFTKRLKYFDPNFKICWRIETQDRGAPHFHIIIFPPKNQQIDPQQNRTIEYLWLEMVNPGGLNKTEYEYLKSGLVPFGENCGKWKTHTPPEYRPTIDEWITKKPLWDVDFWRFGANCQQVTSWRVLMSYVSKYLAKIEPAQEEVELALGRRWGHSRDLKPEAIIDLPVSEKEEFLIRLIVRRWLKRQEFKGCGVYARRVVLGCKSFVMSEGNNFFQELLNFICDGEQDYTQWGTPYPEKWNVDDLKKTIRSIEKSINGEGVN